MEKVCRHAEQCWSRALQLAFSSWQRCSLATGCEEDSLSSVILPWPAISILHVSLEWNQDQEIGFLPKLKKYVETWCAESANASRHLFVQQTETGWSKDAPGILTGCHPFCLCVSWWNLSQDQNKVHATHDLLFLAGTKQPKALLADAGKDAERSSSCFATAHAASPVHISASSYLSWEAAIGMKMRHLSCRCRWWGGQSWYGWDGGCAGLHWLQA